MKEGPTETTSIISMTCGSPLVFTLMLLSIVGGCVYIEFCFPSVVEHLRSFISHDNHPRNVNHQLLNISETPTNSISDVLALSSSNSTSSFTISSRDTFWLSVFLIIGSLTFWSFVQAVRTDPGRVPAAFSMKYPRSSALSLRLTGALHHCVPCSAYKPLRAHHCSKCNRCVLKYDHHCPWIGQCVGFFNYKLYLLFVLYTNMFTSVVTLTIGAAVLRWVFCVFGACQDPTTGVLASLIHLMEAVPLGSSVVTTKVATIPLVAVYLFAFVFQCLTLYLLSRHWKYARHNLTTIDDVLFNMLSAEDRKAWVNKYDLGVHCNLESVFGDGEWSEEGRRGDGAVESGNKLLFSRTRKDQSFFPGVSDDDEESNQQKDVEVPLMRWVWRLLPLSAYGPQDNCVAADPQCFEAVAGGGVPHYGATALVHSGSSGTHLASPPSKHHDPSLLSQSKYLGIVYPIDSQIKGRYHPDA